LGKNREKNEKILSCSVKQDKMNTQTAISLLENYSLLGIHYVKVTVQSIPEVAMEGFIVQPDGTVSWLEAVKGKALVFRNNTYRFLKKKLYFICQKLALKGLTEADISSFKVLSCGDPYFTRDGFVTETSEEYVTKLSWTFAVHGKAKQLRELSERAGIDQYLPYIRLKLEVTPEVFLKVEFTEEQKAILDKEGLRCVFCVPMAGTLVSKK